MVDETDNHGLNKYTQGEDSWEHSSDMDTIEERLTIKDTDANKSNYTPHDGALYIATDTGVVYDGDGSSWVKASRGFESVNTEYINNTVWADSPDGLDAKLQELPTSGGYARLMPGSYDGSEFTDTVDIPAEPRSHYVVDMRGCEIIMPSDGFRGPYFRRQSPSSGTPQLTILGPSELDASNISDPKKAFELWDCSQSYLNAAIRGNFDIGLEMRVNNGSGHQNQMKLFATYPDIGIKVGDTADNNTSDRSEYYGQIGGIRDTGVLIEKGAENQIFAQVENQANGASGTTAYKVRWGDNVIRNFHGGFDGDTILDIQAKRTKLEPQSARDLYVAGSANPAGDPLGIRPNAISIGSSGQVNAWDMSYDPSNDLDIKSEQGDIDTYGNYSVTADAAQTGESHMQTAAQVGPLNRGVLIYATMQLDYRPGSINRWGLWQDSDNYAMLTADYDNHTNWRLEIKSGGSFDVDVDSGETVEDGTWKEFVAWLTPSEQSWMIDYSEIASRSDDLSHLSQPLYRSEARSTDGWRGHKVDRFEYFSAGFPKGQSL